MQISWNKCEGDRWCGLNSVNLDHSHFENMEGVYIIWHGGDSPATVRIGQGTIRDRLAAHRDDSEVQAYSHLTLYATWASVAVTYRDGIEVYLAQTLNPKLGTKFPDAQPIQVNLPWS